MEIFNNFKDLFLSVWNKGIIGVDFIQILVGLAIFQTSVFLFYISIGKVKSGTAPILNNDPATIYSNPLPHVLILTAIVVGVATTALGLALILRIKSEYGTIEENEIAELNTEENSK